ncbi:MAG: ATP-binding protein [Desulfocapsaceae bacterium]|nr:ATP-binding protein [Desulfocapsaceae bacterium]
MKDLLRPIVPRFGLNLKILLTLAVILIGFAVASGTVFNMIQQRELKNHLDHAGEVMVTMLSGSLQSALYFDDHANIDKAVKTFLSLKLNQDLKVVTVYDAKDEVVLRMIVNSGDGLPATRGVISPMATALTAFHSDPDQGKVWEDDELIIFTAPVLVVAEQQSRESLFFDTDKEGSARSVIGYAQLVLSKNEFDKAIGKTVFQTTVLILFFLFISLIATYMLTQEAMTPLKQLIDTIRARSGQSERESDEVGLLDDTFSQLVADLEQAFSTIQDLKYGLEETVTERTRELSYALSELQESHMQLAQAEKMVAIGRLVAGVAHEINNTTNFVSGALPPLRKRITEMEGMAHEFDQEGVGRERCEALFTSVNTLLDNISEGARRTNKIVGDLKSFSRPVDEEPGPVDINQCLRTTCSLAYPEYKHRIELTLDLAEDLPSVEGAQGQLNQVFMNLLLNAVQAQPDEGTILIRSWLATDQIHILFRDSGPGIPAEAINRIFEPFFTTKKVGKGTGLGLSISYGIIKKHQGEILVRSEPAEGTEFEIILPLRRQKE